MSSIEISKRLIIKLKEQLVAQQFVQALETDRQLQSVLTSLDRASLNASELRMLAHLRSAYDQIMAYCERELDTLRHKMAIHRQNSDGIKAYAIMQEYQSE